MSFYGAYSEISRLSYHGACPVQKLFDRCTEYHRFAVQVR